MRAAFVDSGIGLLGYAAALRALRPDVDLVLALDTDHMPYGPRPPAEVARLVVALAESTLAYRPDVLVVACNTASVHGLEALRARFEPAIPVVGTVPAIRPAARTGGPVAIWATAATTGSDYQRRLIEDFADGVSVTPVACHGLAEAIESGRADRVAQALALAVRATPPDTVAVVLGCTHYGLIADRIAAALPGVHLFDSPVPVARQALRRVGQALPARAQPAPQSARQPARQLTPEVVPRHTGSLDVLCSGRPGTLPPAALAYPAGRGLVDAQTRLPSSS